MNIFLYFCPGADPAMPHAALPALAARLRQDGIHDYSLYDLNVEAFLYFLNGEKVTRAREIVQQQLNNGELTSAHPRQEVEKLLAASADLPQRIEDCAAGFRAPEIFYSPDKLWAIKADAKAAFRLLSLQYDPTGRLRFDKYSLFEGFSYNSFEEIRAALEDPAATMLVEFYREKVIPDIIAKTPGLVGFSVPYFPQLLPAFLLAREIRKTSPHTHITYGGPVITWGKETLMRQADQFASLIDSFCIGEGEDCISELAKALEMKQDLSVVPNLVYFQRGKPADGPHRVNAVDLGKLMAPDYSGMPMEKYPAPRRVISLPLTKGCYYNRCRFCNYSFIKMTTYRERPAAAAVRDIEHIIAQTGDRVFSFESDVIRPGYLLEFSRELLRQGVDIKWHAVMRFEKGTSRDFFDVLARAGCVRIYFGLESANPRILQKMDKGAAVEIIQKTLEACSGAGIAAEVGAFLGYPGETVSEARDTLNFIRLNRSHIDRVDTGFFRLLKGAPVVEDLARQGLCPDKTGADYWYTINVPNPTLENDRPTFEGILQELENLFPVLGALDIPEEILYAARFGKAIINQVGEMFERSMSHQEH
ncbi:MAG: anaerobic magnesium-protoporphyrin monomethyl ester cyclase [Acidobacteriota bacterium]|nr:anaerobic magnesium-protoporphyrin monomethyl ester cyclase [Acidobacteriota bacterium]